MRLINNNSAYKMQVFMPNFALKPSQTITLSSRKSKTSSKQRSYLNSPVFSPQKDFKPKTQSSNTLRQDRKKKQSQLSFQKQTLQFNPFFSHDSCMIGNSKKKHGRDFPIHSRKGIRFVSHILNKSKRKGHQGLTMPVKNSSSCSQSPFLVAKKVSESQRKRPVTFDSSKGQGNSFLVRQNSENQRMIPKYKKNFRERRLMNFHDCRPWSPTKMIELDQQPYDQ